MSKDSRRAPRAKILSLTVRYKSATVAEFVENHSYDVSRGGIFIKTASPFPTGTLIKFEVRIAEEQSVMTGVGRVTWRRERDRGPDEPAGMGVKFIKIDDDSVAVIDRLVAARSHAPSNFEDGAAKQGIRLSDPPAPGPSDRSSSRPPPSSDMLDQSSELLKSAVGSLRPGQLSADGNPELPDGDDVDNSQLFKSLGVQKRDADTKDEASDDEEATVPNSGASLRDGANEELDDDVEDADDSEAEDDPDDADDTGARSDSGRPNAKRSKSRKKKSRKKKKKFKYANIPSARTDSDSPRSARQVVGRKSSVEPPVSTLTTTPPTRREGSGASKQESKSSKFGLIAIALIAVIGVGYWLLRDSGKPSSQPSAEPPKAAAAPSATAPSATAEDTSEPSTTGEAPSAEPSATAADAAGQDAGAGGAANDDEAEPEAATVEATRKAAPPKRPAKRPAPARKPRPKAPPKPEPSPASETTTSPPATPPPPAGSGVSTQAAPATSAPKKANPEPTPKAEPPATPKPASPPAPTAVTPAPPSPAPSSSSPTQ